MKRWLTALLAALLMLAAAAMNIALATEAEDITGQVKLKTSLSEYKITRLADRKYTTYLKTEKVKNPCVTMTAPEDTLIGGVYVCFGALPEAWEVQVSEDGKTWTTAAPGPAYLHAWVPLPEPSRYVRVIVTTESRYVLYINEIFALGVGDKPDWVQDWQPTLEKADIMFISTHADDELIFFGGAIPTYAAEMKRDVIVAYFTHSNGTRTSELLNGLWHVGVRNYPVLGTVMDTKANGMADAYKKAGGKEKINGWFVQLYRQYRPEAVVTHDIDGEYGHTQHRIVAQAAIDAVELAADANSYPESAQTWGTWELPKLYLHLWPERQIVMDWEIPLESMGGATGMALADEAFEIHHVTQSSTSLGVRTTGLTYDNRVFGLVHTTVGEDVAKNDFLENIDLSGEAAEAEDILSGPPAWDELLPTLNARGFMDAGEFVHASEEDGLWIFIDETCKVIIQRRHDAAQSLTWYEAELWLYEAAGELLQAFPAGEGAAEIAARNGLVFALGTDEADLSLVEPGHYACLVAADGESVGRLDGGVAAALVFMGNVLNPDGGDACADCGTVGAGYSSQIGQ